MEYHRTASLSTMIYLLWEFISSAGFPFAPVSEQRYVIACEKKDSENSFCLKILLFFPCVFLKIAEPGS